MLSKPAPQHKIDIVREFYVNLLNMDWSMNLPNVFIRGKKVLVDVYTINDALGVPNPLNATFKAKI